MPLTQTRMGQEGILQTLVAFELWQEVCQTRSTEYDDSRNQRSKLSLLIAENSLMDHQVGLEDSKTDAQGPDASSPAQGHQNALEAVTSPKPHFPIPTAAILGMDFRHIEVRLIQPGK